MTDELLTAPEAAKLLGVSVDTLRRWDEAGTLRPDFVTPGSHRRYRRSSIERLSSDLFGAAREWATSPRPQSPEKQYYCETSAVFQTRLVKFQSALELVPEVRDILPLIVAIVGEIGNNSFDHNIGNWPDIPGVFFAYDVHRRVAVLADRGQGILATLRRVRPSLKDDAEAIKVAFTEVVSGRAPEARGNGLKFVYKVVVKNPIRMSLQSGNAEARLWDDKRHLDIQVAATPARGTLVRIEY